MIFINIPSFSKDSFWQSWQEKKRLRLLMATDFRNKVCGMLCAGNKTPLHLLLSVSFLSLILHCLSLITSLLLLVVLLPSARRRREKKNGCLWKSEWKFIVSVIESWRPGPDKRDSSYGRDDCASPPVSPASINHPTSLRWTHRWTRGKTGLQGISHGRGKEHSDRNREREGQEKEGNMLCYPSWSFAKLCIFKSIQNTQILWVQLRRSF